MKLSIIIPFYNTPDYTEELLTRLEPQLTDEVEVMLVDDGTEKDKWALWFIERFPWLKVMRTEHRGQSAARNLGLNNTYGEYIQFIDSDDLVPRYFVSKLLEKIEEQPDLIEYSWRSLDVKGKRYNFKIQQGGRLPNVSACTRCFSRELIGNIRFNEQKDATEDEEFTRKLGIFKRPLTVSIIPDHMYFYRTDATGSTEKRFKSGLCKTKRIVYYFKEITADRADILTAVAIDDRTNEVIVMTYRNDLPEIEQYCRVTKPSGDIWAHVLKGEPFRCNIIKTKEEE